MNNRIPDETIELIRKQTDIVELISDFVQLKKQGQQYIGLCPFHGEKTPSFSVSSEKQLYHCFGCGAGGNVYSFLMELEGLSFVESVKQLATRANIELPHLVLNHTPSSSGDHATIRSAHQLATQLYHRILMLTEEGKNGRTYIENRGFTREQIEYFQIGFAPDRWDTLVTILTNRGISLDLMVKGSLLGQRDSDGGYFDRFRNRLMFPIWDGQGNVIAFGGRTVFDEKPKYLNSSESIIFQKSATLYGIHLARQAIRKETTAILFEGYMDVISAWGAGVRNGIASLGTSLTEEQARMIRRNAETVILCYDGDQAGEEATYRNSQLLEQMGCLVKVANMPNGMDPDDYIQQFGAESFKSDVIGNSMTMMAFNMQYLRKGKNLQDEGDRMTYIGDVLTEISTIKRAVVRDHYLRQLSEEFSLSLEALKQELYQIYRSKNKQRHSKQVRSHGIQTYIEPKKLLPAYHNAERLLLAHMLKDEDVAALVQERMGGKFNIDIYQALSAYLYSYYSEGNPPNPSEFIQGLPDKQLIRTATELAMLPVNDQYNEDELIDYIRQIESYPKKIEIKQKEDEIKREQDPIRAAKILMELNRMKQELY